VRLAEGAPEKNERRKGSAWTLLIVAGMLEPVWVTAMKLSEGFTDIIWAAATFIFLFFSMYLLGKALKMDVPIGTAYAVWVGIGAIGALIAGILLFNEPSDLLRMSFVLLIVIGIAGVQMTSK